MAPFVSLFIGGRISPTAACRENGGSKNESRRQCENAQFSDFGPRYAFQRFSR